MKERRFSKYIPRGLFREDICKVIKEYRRLFRLVLRDNTLDLRIRGNQIHVYYRGGKILDLDKSVFSFDEQYVKVDPHLEYDKPLKKEIEESNRKTLSLKISNLKEAPKSYFEFSKILMNNWFLWNQNNERDDQHHIACANKSFGANNLVVLDIEYAVSFLSNMYNKEYIDKNSSEVIKKYPNPRFDIIAVDREGQIYVLELKTGTDSLGNMHKHLQDFCNLVGSDDNGDNPEISEKRWKTFVKEMNLVLDKLQQYFCYPDDIKIDIDKCPKFMFAYTDKKEVSEKEKSINKEKFEQKVNEQCPDTPIVWVDNHNYYLNL